jgi:hypothetical protein
VAGAAVLAAVAGAGAAYGTGLIGSSAAPQPATTLPTVTFGSYTGRQPGSIVLNPADSTGVIQGIHWSSWTAGGATGAGTLGAKPATVTLSSPAGGRFTRMGETVNGRLIVQAYPDNDWPTGASPAGTAIACVKPTPAALLKAWHAAPASTQQGWAAPEAVTGFADVQCWKDWVVAQVIGNGDGNIVFSASGGLHLPPETGLQQFSDAVCTDPTAPKAWTGPGTGPAIC